jgi:nucleoside-diphosphate-sugar epimerase
MQTILGSGGAIGIALCKELKNYTDKIRLVARNPRKVHEEDEIFVADLLNKDQVNLSVKGSEIVYLTAGLPYSIKVWKRDWPVIMQNVIDACVANKAKLVFFDNVYMYSPEAVKHMTEESPIAPKTRKGRVRAEIAEMIFNAIKNKNLSAMITRSADFYGKNAATGILNLSVIDNYKKNKKAFWQSDADKIHSFTYVPDAAKAVALLGNTPDAYNQVWHLPTSHERWTGKEFIQFTAKQMNVKPRYYILSKFMLTMLGIFSTSIKELKEMQYQNDREYFFDSSKFEKRFSFTPTSYEEGIKECVS